MRDRNETDRESREARLAARLRDNLRRRKAPVPEADRPGTPERNAKEDR